MKERIAHALLATSKIAAKLAAKLLPSIQVAHNKKSYAPLTPADDIPDSDAGEYFDALNWALNQKEIKNIALTGPYGAGKSSILLSFQNKFKQHNFLSISLATFGTAGSIEDEVGRVGAVLDSEVDHKLIEQSILQQIFYKKRQEKIPDSKYSRRSVVGFKKLTLYTGVAAIWLLSLCRLMNLGFLRQPVVIDRAIKWSGEWLVFLSYLIVVSGVIVTLYYAIRIIRNLTFQKVKLSVSSIEVEAEKGKSPLNENFDELLYFFEATGYHGLIIEDLDRFQSTDIFSRLRELNLLLNSSEQIEKKPIVFIYGIKDDLFVAGDRTKFFDFIVPVIPVVSPSNAGDKLYQMLSNAGAAANLPLSYVFRIGSFISDMRMVRNIFNEYLMYRDKLGIEAAEKLLGIIAYKNIFPRDFSDLHIGQGVIYQTFSRKQQVVNTITESMAEEIKDIEEQINRLESEVSRNIEELNTIYVSKIREHLPNIRSFYVGGRHFSPRDILSEASFNELRAQHTIQYTLDNSYRQDSQISFATIEAEVAPMLPYSDRFRIIKEKESIDLVNLKSDLARKKIRYEQSKGLSLKEHLASNTPEIFNADLTKYPLLAYLFQYGAIDEQYQFYISNFYEGVLRKEDQIFLMAVTNRQGKPFSFILANLQEVIKRLQVDDFKGPAILNFSLVDFLLQNKGTYQTQLNLIVGQLIEGSEDIWTFLNAYRENSTEVKGRFFKFISATWPQFWIRTIGKFKDRSDELLDIFAILLDNCSLETLISLNIEQTFSDYLRDNYFEVAVKTSPSGDTVTKDLIGQLGIKIPRLIAFKDRDSLDFITGSNYYELTSENVSLILSVYSHKSIEHPLTYTEIMKSGIASLIEHFHQNINHGVELLLNDPTSSEDDPKNIVTLLNSSELSTENKLKFIAKANFILPDISMMIIDDDDVTGVRRTILQEILANSRLAISWENVSSYFEELGFDATLAKYLSTSKVASGLAGLSSHAGISNRSTLLALAKQIYISADISEDTFSKLQPVLPEVPLSILDEIPQPRLSRLISEGKIAFSQETLNKLDSIDDEVAWQFIRKNVIELDASVEAIDLLPKHIEAILKYPNINENKARIVFGRLTSELIMANLGLAEIASDMISENKVNVDDSDIVGAIFNSKIDQKRKEQLFLASTKNFPYDVLIDYLATLGLPYNDLCNGRTEFDDYEVNTDILKYLKKQSFIQGYKVQAGKLQINTTK